MLSLSYARGIRGVATEVLGRKAEIRPQAVFPRQVKLMAYKDSETGLWDLVKFHTRLDIFTSRLDEA